MKNPVRNLLIFVGAVVVLLFVRQFINTPSDEQLIDQALTDAIEASKEGRPGPVLDFISQKAKFNDEGVGARAEISNYIKQFRPDVVLTDRKPTINADTATIITPVKVSFGVASFRSEQTIESVTIQLEREATTTWFIIPTSKWRVTRVTAPEEISVPG